jgi:predicted nucleotidyltransferase
VDDQPVPPETTPAPVISDPVAALHRLLRAGEDGRLDALADRHDLTFLVVHGSVARGEPGPRDLDLAFLGGPRTDVLALRHDLYLVTGYEGFDLADLAVPDAIGRGIMLQDAIGLYERTPGSFADYRATAVTRYAADRWLLDRQREAMAR